MQEQIRKSFIEGKPPTMIFTLMTLTNILINLDHGILPACTNEMKKQFDMGQAELGILGSIVYLGIVIMGFFAGRLYQHFNSKILTVVALLALQLTLLLFVLSDSKYTAYVSRFFTGVCQVFLLVYYPIWIDKYGFDKKTLWLTLLQICVPVGIFIGYGMTAIIIQAGLSYQWSFYIQIGLVACFILAFLLLSKKKLDSRRKLSQDLSFQQSLIDPNQASIITENELSPQQKKKHKYKFSVMMKKLLKSKMYLVGTITMSVILFVSTGIQFWLTDYFINVLKFQRGDVNIAYAIVSMTGPTTGCAVGGWALSRIGGYDHPKSVFYVFSFSVIAIGAAVAIPFCDNFYVETALLWFVLFFGGAMMPGLTGIMMSSVSPYLRAFGNSNGQIIKNILGYLPSPFVYGLLNSELGQRAGIKFLMFWGLWAPILLLYGSIHKYRHLKKIELLKLSRKSQGKDEEDISVYSDMEDSQAQSVDEEEEEKQSGEVKRDQVIKDDPKHESHESDQKIQTSQLPNQK